MTTADKQLKVLVCIKQVPDTTDIKWTENNTIQRDGLDSVINPFDLGALQIAKNLKFLNKNTEISVVTMGPKQAKNALKEAIAICADKAYLLCDKKFAGSDTLATAYTLSAFVKKVIPDFDLIICGQQAVDGDTAQTPSSLAQKLDIEQITNVVAIKSLEPDSSVWIKDTQFYKQELKVKHPALIAVKIDNITMIPTINGHIKSQDTPIVELCAEDIEADPASIGLKGSPTFVRKAFRHEIIRNTVLLQNESGGNIAGYILEEINKCRTANNE